MVRSVVLAALAGLALAGGAIVLRPVVWAQAARTADPAAAAEASRGSAQDSLEARRARERAAMLDRQARSSLVASDRAAFRAAALAARVQQAEAALAVAEADLALNKGVRRALDARLARESAPIAQLLAGLQAQVRRPPMLQLLQPGSITDAVHLRAVVVAIEPQIRDRTAALRREVARARDLERETLRIASQRRLLQSELLARKNELATLSAAERLRARRAAGAADREAERALALGAGARDPFTLVRRLEPRFARAETREPAAGNGIARAAVDAGAPHRLPVQGRPVANQSSRRKGLTLATRPGALVVAPGAGRVAFAGPFRGFGNIVIVEHAEGWSSLLTGLAATRVAVGQAVVAGSPLGEAPARNPRITVELRQRGVAVDPSVQLR